VFNQEGSYTSNASYDLRFDSNWVLNKTASYDLDASYDSDDSNGEGEEAWGNLGV